MKHIRALFVKTAFIEAVTVPVLLFFGATLSDALVIGLVLAVLLYFVGDLIVLPTLGNVAATIGDSGLAFLLTWSVWPYINSEAAAVRAALIVAALVGLVEWFYHKYVARTVFPGPPLD